MGMELERSSGNRHDGLGGGVAGGGLLSGGTNPRGVRPSSPESHGVSSES